MYVLSIDQGTTSTRAILFDKLGQIVDQSQMEFTQLTPLNGYVLHNPLEIMETVYEVVRNVLNRSNISLSDIDSIGITNQRETTVLWDKKTGKPVYEAIVWQSRQSLDICEEWIKKGYKDLIYDKTGLLINPYFSASKIKWILRNFGLEEKAKKGEILFGTIDTWILYNLTNNHFTDYTNASRTMLFNIRDLKWDLELLKLLEIPEEILPTVMPSGYNFGIAHIEGIEGSAPICSMIGDQQASLFGQCAFDYGDIKNTYGTGCFMLMNTKESLIQSSDGLLTTIAYGYNNKVYYALEGSVFVSGAAIQWLRDGLKIIKDASETEEMALSVNEDDVYFVPAFVGLGTPYWDNEARGAIFGLTRGTKKEHIAKAALNAICFQSRDVLDAMRKAAHTEINSIYVDGGSSKNDYLMQFQANLLGKKIARPRIFETTALGAAYLSGLTTGFYESLEEIKRFHTIDKFFMPIQSVEEKYKKWLKAVEATRVFK